MDKESVKERMQRVINTLKATKLRVDDEEAADRVRACARELMSMMDEMDEEGSKEDE